MTLTISLFFSLSFLFFFHVDAFNITKMLTQFSDFTTFNDYLTRIGVANEINSRQALTIFVFDNNAASILPSLPDDSIGKILRAHVVFDYCNIRKLENIQNGTGILTTLFSTTGRAIGMQGHLNVTKLNTGVVAIGSAIEGAPLNANLVKSVLLQPYDISILQISDVIIPLGVDNSITNSRPTPSPMNSLPPSPSPSSPLIIPGAAAGATLLPPSPTPRKSLSPSPTPTTARAPTPRNLLSPSPTPMAGGAPTPRNPLPPSPTPMAAGATTPRNSLPPSTTPMAAGATTPRNSLPPSPTSTTSPRNSLAPSPTPTASGSRKSLSPGPAKDQSPSSTSAPSDVPSSETSLPSPPSPAPISVVDALPSPPSTNNSSSASTTIWFGVVATMIIVATTFTLV